MLLVIIALILAGASVPLIFRWVPMNRLYGVRFSQSFKSDQHWYEINRVGGVALLVSSVPVAIAGLVWLASDPLTDSVRGIGWVVSAGSPVMSLVYSYVRARSFDKALQEKFDLSDR